MISKETIYPYDTSMTEAKMNIELPPIYYNRAYSPDNFLSSASSASSSSSSSSSRSTRSCSLSSDIVDIPPSFLEPNPNIQLNHQLNYFSLNFLNTLHVNNSIESSTSCPASPIMVSATYSAIDFASQRDPSAPVIQTLLDFIHHQSRPSELNKELSPHLDQSSLFLTKNAHIKRPRNAWIHFRCHYGQALKSQDPTLRAEEISKRASLRWSKLSDDEKKPWHGLAEQEKLIHREAFPEYRYCPRRSLNTNPAYNRPQKKVKRN